MELIHPLRYEEIYMYIVVKMFDDLQDTKVVGGIRTYHRYNVGDEYPREGYTPTSERVRSLLTGNNPLKVPLIGILEEKLPEKETLKAPETAEEVKMEEQPTEEKKAPEKPVRKQTARKKPAAPKKTARNAKKA